VLRYWQTIISFCHNTRIWQTDGQTKLRQQYRALHYMHSHGKKWSLSSRSNLHL